MKSHTFPLNLVIKSVNHCTTCNTKNDWNLEAPTVDLDGGEGKVHSTATPSNF